MMSKNFINIKKFKDKIIMGFFTNQGGVSKGPYLSLNCSNNNDDDDKNVEKNIYIALKNIGIQNKKLKIINQIHSNKVFLINKSNFKKKFKGDGLITKDRNLALGVLTADCAPIFIFNKQNTIICCLHSGWKGALNNIVREGIKKIISANIQPKDIIAVVGPCLGIKHFEVDNNFKINFIKKNRYYTKFFKFKNKQKSLFNLRGMINYQLENEGISNIFNIKKDTYTNRQLFFSHRRSTHQNKIKSGRMINIISLKD